MSKPDSQTTEFDREDGAQAQPGGALSWLRSRWHALAGSGRGKRLLQSALPALGAILIATSQETLDPFGFDSVTDGHSEKLFNAITSPFYGSPAETELTVVQDDGSRKKLTFDSRLGQSNIIVLLIGDSYLESQSRTWPLRTREYRNMLQKLVGAEAAAVFVDVYFRQENEQRVSDIERLFDTSRCLEEASRCPAIGEEWSCGQPSPCGESNEDSGTAIFFAGTLPNPKPNAAGLEPSRTALAMMMAEEGHYQFVHEDYTSEPQIHDTAAWAVYKAWCVRSESCDESLFHKFRNAADTGYDPMYLHWGYAPGAVLTEVPDFNAAQCQKQATSFVGRIAQSMMVALRNMFSGFPYKKDAFCPYHTQIKLELFNRLSQDELNELFRDRIVLIGASIKNFPDYQWSPVHGNIPGVFWHAMAIDNLIEFGTEYRRIPDANDDAGVTPDTMSAGELVSSSAGWLGMSVLSVEVAGALIILLLNWVIGSRVRAYEDQQVSKLQGGRSLELDAKLAWLDFCHATIAICFVGAFVVWNSGINYQSPSNWVGLILLLALVQYRPYTSLVRAVKIRFPIEAQQRRRLGYVLYWLMIVAAAIVTILLAIFLLILPHAFLLGQYGDGTAVSITSIAIYFVLAAFALHTIRSKTAL